MYEPDSADEEPGQVTNTESRLQGCSKIQEDKNSYTIMDFLEADTYREKREIFIGMKKYMDTKLVNDIAASLDVVVDDADIETQYNSLLSCLNTLVKFECNRLR